jgi:hypothetical protein
MTATTVIIYKRGDQYVKNQFKKEEEDKKTKKQITVTKTAHGLVGEMWVHGLCFETIERMDGYVCLDGGKDYSAALFWHNNLDCYVIFPRHTKRTLSGQSAGIFVHKASFPSHLEGCIAPGFFEGKTLTLSRYSMEVIWEQCGGKAGVKNKQIEATFRVEGDMKRLTDCTAY